MMHHQDNFFKKKEHIILLISVLMGVAVLFFAPLRLLFSRALYSIAPSIWTSRNTLEFTEDSFLVNFKIKRSLVYENTMLHEENARMQAQVLDRNMLEEKVLRLEEALGRTTSDNRVFANVLSGVIWSPYDVLSIDGGSAQHIVAGDSVVYAGMGGIGTIAEVFPSSAKVKLFSSPGEEQMVVVGIKKIPASAYGRGMGNFIARVPKDSPVSVGDSVYLVQNGIILGIVGEIEEEPSLPFMQILFRTPFNISEIRSVEVII